MVYNLVDSKTTGASVDMYVEFNATYQEHANKVTSSSAYTINKVLTELKKVGTGGTWECKIYTGASTPTTLVATSTSVNINTAIPDTTNFYWVSFDFATPYTVTSGQVYWIVMNNTGGYSNTNYIYWKYLNSGSGARIYYWNGSSWINTGYTGFSDANYKVYWNTTLTDGIKSLYKFTGNANDTSGNGYNLTVTGATLANDKNSVANQASDFSGSSQYMEATTAYLNGLTRCSVSMWFYFDTNSAYRTLYTNYNGSNENVFICIYNGGQLIYAQFTGTDGTVAGNNTADGAFTGTFATGQWYHLCMVWDGSASVKIYKNGALLTTVTGTLTAGVGLRTATGNLRIGGQSGISRWVDGRMDEIITYQRELSPAEVNALYLGYDSTTSPLTEYNDETSDTSSFGRGNLSGQSFTPNANWTVSSLGIRGSKGNVSSGTNYYLAVTDKVDQFYGTPGILNGLGTASNWEAQTFTAGSSYTIKNVLSRMCRTGTSTGNITVSIRATSAGLPTGSDLCSGTFARSLLGTETSNANWMRINLGAGTALTSGTMYAIVIRSDTEDGVNYTRLATDTAGTYSGGTRCFSSNSGSTWSNSGATGHDLPFACFGEFKTFDTNTITSLPAYTATPSLFNINLSSSISLTSGTKYSVLLIPKEGSETDELRWSLDNTSPYFADGAAIINAVEDSTKDRNFAVFGTVTGGSGPATNLGANDFGGL